jgi:hypothetical protein
MRDEIIEELWRIKDEIAKEYHYDPDALVAALRRQQQDSGRKVVNLEKEASEQAASPSR